MWGHSCSCRAAPALMLACATTTSKRTYQRHVSSCRYSSSLVGQLLVVQQFDLATYVDCGSVVLDCVPKTKPEPALLCQVERPMNTIVCPGPRFGRFCTWNGLTVRPLLRIVPCMAYNIKSAVHVQPMKKSFQGGSFRHDLPHHFVVESTHKIRKIRRIFYLCVGGGRRFAATFDYK